MRRVELDLERMGDGGVGGDGASGSVLSGGQTELLRRRAGVLGGRDRAILEMYFEKGSSFAQMAHVAGVSETSIARKIRRLTAKLLEGEYVRCLRRGIRLSRLERAIAKDYFVDGLSQRAIATKRDTTVYQVRKTIRKVVSSE